MSEDSGGLGLTKLDASLSTLRTMIVNIGFFIAMILLIPTMGAQIVRNPIVIEPIGVPEALADRGLTSAVAANRVWDGLQDFSQTAAIARQSFVAVPDSQLVEFALPGSGLSVDAIVKQLRQFFGSQETRIAGEIICQTSDCAPEGQRLRLRVVGRSIEIIDLPPLGTTPVPAYFREAAAGIYDVLDPLIGAAARAVTDPEGAIARARRIATAGGPDARWAHVLLGDIALSQGNGEDAKTHYLAALVDDSAFLEARIGLVRAALALGQNEDARTTLSQLPSDGDKAAVIIRLQADLAAAEGDLDGARQLARAAAEADPLSPAPLVHLGTLALEAGEVEDARAALREALAIDPGYGAALQALGEMHRAEGDLEAAEALVRDWADYAPDDSEALRALIAVRLEREDFEGAAETYGKLTDLTVLTPNEAMGRAQVLQELKRYAEAGDAILALTEATPPLPEAVLLLAQLHDEAGRAAKARPLYEHYLTLGTELPGIEMAKAALDRLGD
ncbi:tetratricopeptide repeat protein [Devosia sp. LjRoot3]|uniref:tetratricopeptide repeat protein n=1 Tax=Devosia sp. LjRoot3 TaxID=3342319 RepID=UPI003ED0040A